MQDGGEINTLEKKRTAKDRSRIRLERCPAGKNALGDTLGGVAKRNEPPKERMIRGSGPGGPVVRGGGDVPLAQRIPGRSDSTVMGG